MTKSTNPASWQAIIKQAAKITGQSQPKTSETAYALTFVLAALITQGHAVRWPDLGTFDLSRHKRRKGRNPSTGKPLLIKARNAVRFRAAGALKTAVNQ